MKYAVKISSYVLFGLVCVCFLGGATEVLAGVTVPNTFGTGAPISSSQMNTNFDTLENALPGANVNKSDTYITIGTSATTVLSVTITAPRSGYVLVNFTGIGKIVHVNGTQSYLRVHLNSSSTPIVGAPSFIFNNVPSTSASATYFWSISNQRMFAVSAGTNTFYAYADYSAAAGGSAQIGYPYMSAVFVPNLIGTPPVGY